MESFGKSPHNSFCKAQISFVAFWEIFHVSTMSCNYMCFWQQSGIFQQVYGRKSTVHDYQSAIILQTG